ncbi:MAG: amino acid adenylation domain-containing protein [Chloroflexota bacterium]
MTIDALLQELREKEVRIWVDGDKLRYRTASGTLPTELRQKLSIHKTAIIQFLQQTTQRTQSSLPITPVARTGDLPLSFAEERLWLIHQLEPDIPLYHLGHSYRLDGSLNIHALEQSINTLLARHETIRTTFRVQDGVPVRVITKTLEFTLPVVDISNAPAQSTRLAQLIAQEKGKRIDFEQPSLFRVKLIRLAAEAHVLVMRFHHIICDEWSLGIFWQELRTLYDAFCQNQPNPLPPCNIQYADFAHWQRSRAQEIIASQLSYWRSQLQAVPPLIALPIDYPRPQTPAYHTDRVESIIPSAVYDALVALSERENCTLFMTLLAAFQTLLFRYTSQEKIAVGSPIANRMASQTESVVGFFLNTLVLCADFSDNLTFVELLNQVRTTTLDAYQHQELPFEKLVEVLQPERAGYHPLFQVMFIYQQEAETRFGLSGLTATPIRNQTGRSEFDLTLSVSYHDGQAYANFLYNCDLFEPATIHRMANHFHVLLTSITAENCLGIHKPVAALPILTDDEKHQLLIDWNDTKVDYPDARCLHQLFEQQAAKTPDAIAVIVEDRQLTYRTVDEQANQLTHFLIAQGANEQPAIGVFMERSLDMLISVLAILKAGCAYVPLEPEYPQKRLSFIVNDADITLVLTHTQLENHLLLGHTLDHTDASTTYINVDTVWAEIAAQSTDAPPISIQPHDSAYLFYTSGSTGQPKGVMTNHRAIVNRIVGMTNQFPLQHNERVLQKTPLSFDVSVWETFWPLSSGATLVLANGDGHKDPDYLVTIIQQLDISAVYFNCSMLQVWIETTNVDRCTSLKRIFCGGEALSVDLMQRVFARLDVTLNNLYGPTEAAIYVSHWQCDPAYPRVAAPIGRPVSNVQLYIVDEMLQPVPIGVVGELLIGGVQVAEGYHNRPALTKEKFIPDQFSSDKMGNLLYRTGDLARWRLIDAESSDDESSDAESSDAGAHIEFLGRMDQQIKLRGFRIELGEIEAVLRQHPSVQEVVVVVRQREDTGASLDQDLVAYIIPTKPLDEGHHICDHMQYRRFLVSKLPDYMLPTRYIHLDALPLLANNKLNLQALPDPALTEPIIENRYVAPQTPTEITLADLWADILHVHRVGIHDNFFALGGHSLKVVQVMSRTHTILGVKLPLRLLFEMPTIAALAEAIDAQKANITQNDAENRFASLVPIKPASAQANTKSPLFWVPGGAGGEEEFAIYAPLIHLLGEAQPVYGFYARGLLGMQSPHQSVEAMAAHYIDEMRRVQPDGPYWLVGECIGGKVAYEMARQLTAQSQPVAALVLLNAGAARYSRSRWRRLSQRVQHHVSQLQTQSLTEQVRYVVDKTRTLQQRVLPLSTEQQQTEHLARVRANYNRLLQNYTPQTPYAGSVYLLISEEHQQQNPTMGWADFVLGGITVYCVPGTHDNYLGKHVEITVAQMKACLDSVS